MSEHLNSNVQSFEQKSHGYASHRPTYPDALFKWIIGHCRHNRRAWDCATGNGQAAISLSKRFERVDATDLSEEQVANGFEAGNITYRAAPAEDSGFADNSFDLITVAQAVHWFDFSKFWHEVRRVARDGAFFCAWGYGFVEGDQEISEQLIKPAEVLFDPYWARGNRIIMSGYKSEDLQFPFERVDAPEFAIEVEWSIEDLLNFFRTWSAFKLMKGDPAREQIQELFTNAASRFADQKLELRMPICVAAGRIE